ncbi:MAG: tol-pal system YbgF family protein [Phycisphaerales bacterium]
MSGTAEHVPGTEWRTPRLRRCSAARVVLSCALLATVFVLGACSSPYDNARNAGGSALVSPLAPSAPPDAGERTVRESPDARVAELVDRAFQLLVTENRPEDAARVLAEAQAIDGWSRTPHAADVLFWLAHAYDRLGERAAAMSTYRQLLLRYPESSRIKRAKRRLTELEVGGPMD